MKDQTTTRILATHPGCSAESTTTQLRGATLLLLTMILSVLAACGGGGGGSEGAAVSAPLNAGIDENVQRNPENVINATTVSAVEIEVSFGPDVNPGDTFEVTLSDGVNSVSAGGTAVPDSSVTVGPIDASSLNDGPISLSVTMSNGGNSATTQYGFLLFKDTTAPEPATLVTLPAGSGNAAGVINTNNQASFAADVTFSATASASDLVQLVASDGNLMVTSVAQNVVPGGVNSFTGFDLSSLADGQITIDAVVMDAAENSATTQALAQKDATVPTVLVARINASAQNPANVINNQTQGAPVMEIAFNAVVVAGDMYAVRATDDNATVFESTPAPVPAGGGTIAFSGLDMTNLIDGNISIEVLTSDLSGNNVAQGQFNATKETQLTPVGDAFVYETIGEASNFINQGNAGSVRIFVNFRSGEIGSNDEQAHAILTANGVTATSPTRRLSKGSETLELGPFDATVLTDGNYTLDIVVQDSNGNSTTFEGTPGVVDVSGPIGASGAFIQAGAMNAANIVNSFSETSVSVAVNFLADPNTRNAKVILSDGANVAQSSSQSVPVGGGVVNFSGINAQNLNDGTLTLTIETSDPGGNATTDTGTAGTKDTFVSLPVSAQLASFGDLTNVINSTTATNAQFFVILAANATGVENFRVQVSDGAGSVMSASQPGAASASLVFAVDVSSLNDGALTVSVIAADSRGNSGTFAAGTVTKDTAPPANPTAAFVAFGGSNAANSITQGSQDNVIVQVDHGASAVAGDTFSVRLFNPNGAMITSGTATIVGPSTNSRIVMNATSLADGPVSILVDLADAVGNTASFAGTAAVKDTQAATAMGGMIAATPNNADHFINLATVNSVFMQAELPKDINAGDQVSMSLSAGGVTVTSPSSAAPTLGGIMNFNVSASTLPDGPVKVLVNVVESATGNMTTTEVTPGLKDVVTPDTVASAALIPSGSAPALFVNSATESNVGVTASYGAIYDGTESIELELQVGGLSVAGGSVTAQASAGMAAFTGLDLSSLPDGEISAIIRVTDIAGNQGISTFNIGTKDTAAPEITTTFRIIASGSIPANTITAANQGAITIVSNKLTGVENDLQISVSLTDGINTVSFPTQLIADPNGSIVLGPIDCTSLTDGNIMVTGVLTDGALNQANFTAGTLFKDATAPVAPLAASFPVGGSNPVDFVNIATQSSATISVTFDTKSESADNVVLVITDGVSVIRTPAVSAPAGSSTVAYSGIDLSSLNDGSISFMVEVADPLGNTVTINGMPATKDTIAPILPTSLNVAAGANNTVNFISSGSETAAIVEAVWPATAVGTESAVIDLGGLLSGAMTIPAGGGPITFPPVDVSGLADGTLSLSTTVSEPSGNTATLVGVLPVKDTVPPVAPTSAAVAMGAQNAAGIINSNSESTVMVDVLWRAGADAADLAQVTLKDGVTQTSSLMQNVNPGMTTTFAVDASMLMDGTINIDVTVIDPAGNSSVNPGSAALKDTVAPGLPTTAGVAAGANNDADVINSLSAGAVQVDVIWPAGADATDTATISLNDGVNPVVTSSSSAAVPGGTVPYTVNAAGLADGNIMVTVDVTDANGNTASFTGTMAGKDTVIPTAPTSAQVMAGAQNAADIINSNNVGAVTVAVTWPAGADAADMFSVQLSDGGNMPSSSMINVIPGTTQNIVIDGTSLVDGAVAVTVNIEDAARNPNTFNGMAATKDITPPGNPTSGIVAAGAGNAMSIINTSSEGAVQIDVLWPGGADATDSATVSLSDGVNPAVTSVSMNANPGLTVSYTVDASSLADGPIAMIINLTDANGNTATFNGTGATKDTVAPVDPTAASVPMGGSNPADYINIATNAAVQVDVTWPAGADAADTATVTFDDSVNPVVTSGSMNVNPGATVSYTLNASGLADGPIAITVTTTDVNGNSDTFTGTAATKDVVVPVQPTAAAVNAGAMNAADIINEHNDASVMVDVVWPGGADATDTAVVRLDDTVNPVVDSSSQAANPGATVTYATNSTTLNEGAIALSVIVTDLAGNTSTFNGTAATKDVTDPGMPTSADVAAGGGNAMGIINISSVGAVQVDVVWPGGADPTDSATISLGDGANPAVTSSSMAANPGATVSYTVDASSLNDGPISVTVNLSDANGNTASLTGTAATKDVVAPTTPTAASVPMSASNPADFINIATNAAVGIDVVWPAGADASDTATVSLDDSANPVVTSGSMAANPGATVSYTVNASGLNDGAIAISVTVTDTNGNSSTFTGTAATKDVVLPVLPTAASVNAGAMNAMDVINEHNDTSVQVDTVWPGGADGSDSAFVRIDDTVNPVVESPSSAPTPGGTTVFALNTASLNEGALVLTVIVTDAAGNSDTFTGTAPTRDVTDPGMPTSADVAAGGGNAMGIINISSAGAVQVDVVWPGGADASDSATISLGDGVNPDVTSTSMAANPGATVSYTVDASSLNDGPITLTVNLTDTNGNVDSFTGTAATKDVVAPVLPTAGGVNAGSMNAADIINEHNEASVMVDITWPAGADAADMAFVRIDDSANPVVDSSTMAATPGASATYSLDSTGLNEGGILVSVIVTDPAGNTATFNATAATKDITDPGNPTSADVAAGAGNAMGIINTSSASAVQVDVVWPGGADATDTATITLSDGANPDVTSTSMAANPGATVSYTVDASSLNDGAISVTVNLTDVNGNTASFAGTGATKDTVAPGAPTSVSVPMGGSNPANFINIATNATVQVDVVWPGGADASDTATVSLDDSANPVVTSGSMNANPGATVSYTVNASSLNDGTITISATMTDVNGNTASFTGTAAIKDVVVPVNPTSASVSMGAMNPADVINEHNLTTVMIDVVWSGSSDATDSAFVRLDDTANPTVDSSSALATPGATSTYTVDATSLNEGAINLQVVMTDAAGNMATFNATSATKDVTDPGSPTSANVAAGGGNAMDIINISSVGTVQVDVVWPGGADATDSATVSLGDGVAADVVSGSMAANPGATVSYTLDASTLGDGPITVTVNMTDVNGNTDSFSGTAATKDTFSPTAPTAASVPMGGSNPADFINIATNAAVQVDVVWPAGADAADTATVSLDDSANPVVTSGAMNANPGATVSYTVNASSLNDGAIAISVTVTDVNGNTTSFTGTAATKDTVAPTQPTAAAVNAGAMNAADIINSNNLAAVMIDVAWPGGADAGDSAIVRLDDSANPVVDSASMAPTPGASATYSMDATSLNDGAVALSVIVTDTAGNSATFAGTAATKDVVAPGNPTSADVAAGGGNAMGIINISSVGAVQVDVVWPGGADATDSATISLGDGINPDVTSGSMAANPGATVSYTLDASSLSDGAITVTVNLTDVNGNTASFAGTGATKDTFAPTAPTAASVPMGGSNPADYINMATNAAVQVDVVWPAGADAADTATVSLDDSANPVVTSGAMNANPGATVSYTLNSSSLNDGAIAVTVTVTDVNGNTTSFNGTAATKDVVAPVQPTAAAVNAGAMNSADIINSSNVGAVMIDVAWPGGADGTDTAIVRLDDSVNPVVDSSSMAATPGASATYSIDASSLADGAVTVDVIVTDLAGNTATFNGTAATKDVVAPGLPTSADVAAGGGNAMGIINISSVGTVQVDVVWPGGADASDTATVSLGDGANPDVTSGSMAANPGATVSYTLNAGSLNDGPISVTINVSDVNGNTASFAGTAASKDTVAPTQPTAAAVNAGAMNPADTINEHNLATVMVDVVWPGGADAADSAIVRFDDSANPVVDSSSAAPTPGASSTYALDATSLNDGAIALSVIVTDGAGNSATFAGTAATKDIVDPGSPTSANVAAGGGNAANFINISSVGTVQVDVVWPGGADPTDSATVSLGDGVAADVVSGSMAANPGATVSYTLDASTLGDGPITVTVNLTDANGNTDSFSGTSATKDTFSPTPPVAASVPAGGSNPADFINIATNAAVQVDVVWPIGADAGDMATVTFDDSVNPVVTSGAMAANPGGTVSYTLNASGLNDGSIAITVDVVDAAGNTSSFTGMAATKDVVAPTQPTAAAVNAGAMNSADIINSNNLAAVMIDVAWPGGADAGDSAIVRLDDSANPVVDSASMAPTPGASATYSMDATSLNDGAVALSVIVTDTAGNSVTFAGTAATKDVVAPGNPTSADVAAGGGNAMGVINISSVGAVQVDVVWPGGADATDSATISLGDGINPDVTSGSMAANPGATVSYTLDASSLSDGAITVTVNLTDVNGNTASFAGTGATKDTSAPTAPTAASVPMGGSNPADYINMATNAAVQVDVVWPAGADAADTATVSLDDSANPVVTSGAMNANPGATVSYTLNSSSLNDGAIAVTVTVTDVNGNTTSFNGTAATKDVVAPVQPTAAAVNAGAMNSADIINSSNVGAVMIDVAWPGGADGTDTAIVRLDDSVNPVVDSSSMAATPGASATYSIDASSLADGAVTVDVIVTDLAGNTATFNGTAATKDVVAPGLPTSADVAAGGGNAMGIINISSVGTVQVDVVWPGGADASDTATVSLGDGANPDVTSGSMAANPGATVSYTLNAGSLNDGPISVTINVSDVNGNTASFAGTAASKDTVAPVQPTAAAVNAGAMNPADTINENNVATAMVDVVWPGGADAADSAIVRFDDSANPVVDSSAAAPTPGASSTYALNATSLNDGAIALSVIVTDAAGNSVTFAGAAATKDVVDPGSPTSADVAAGGGNAMGVINISSAGAVQIDLVWPGGADPTDTATVSLGDGANPDVTSTSMAANPGATVSYTMDASSLNDGVITVTVNLTDANGNTDSFTGTAATKDTSAPVAPTAASVPAGGSNPADYINIATNAAVQVDVIWPAGADAADSATVTLDDSVNPVVTSGSMAASPGATVSYTLNASGLNDGAIAISVTVTDVNGNTTSFNGTAATKDVVAPVLPTAGAVNAGSMNGADIINTNNESSVMMDVVWPGGADATDTAIVRLDDTVNPVVDSSAMAATPGATATYTVDASSLADGAVALSVIVTDLAGNTNTFAGTAATKDTMLPIPPTSADVAAGAGNAMGVINISSVGTVQVDVVWPGGADVNDMATISLGDGANPDVTSGAMAANPGATVSYTVDASSLNDGPITVTVNLVDINGNTDSFSGTGATKDTSAPTAPSTASVPLGGSNPADFINFATNAAAQIDVTWPGGADATDTATVTLDDSVNPVVTSGAMAVNPGATVSYTLNAAGLNDGSIAVTVTVTDVNGNSTSFNGTSATKDVVAPVQPTAAAVNAGAMNAADIINEHNEASVMIDVVWPAGADAADSAIVRLDDTVNPVVDSSSMAPTPGAAATYTVDASSLAEGAVTMNVIVTDLAGNSSTFAATSATKDVTDPVAPTSAFVAAGAGNAMGVINAGSQSTVQVDVVWPAGADPTDSAIVTLGDFGANPDVSSASMPANPGATVSYTLDASSLADGSISVTINLTDANGNTADFSGTVAGKDVVAPMVPTSASVAASGMNPVGFINAASVSAAQIDVVWPAGSDPSDMATVTLDDTVNPVVTTGAMAANPGATVSHTADTTGLADGTVNISVTVTDSFGNSASFNGTAATKDTAAPLAPTSANVVAGPSNAINGISGASASSVMVDVTFNAGADAANSAFVTLSDGSGSAFSTSFPVNPGATSTATVNASGLMDGAISVDVNVVDLAGNVTAFSGTMANKDGTAPDAPTLLQIPAGVNNPANVVNAMTESSSSFAMSFTANSVASDSVMITVTDSGMNALNFGPFAARAGAGVQVYTMNDLSTLLDGALTVDCTVTDLAGNQVMFTGMAATKDSVLINATAAGVAAGASNAANVINIASTGAVAVDVTFPGTADGSETATVTLFDGAVNVSSAPTAVAAMGGVQTFSGIDASTLTEGVISVSVAVSDANGNMMTFVGTSALKDVTLPEVATSANVDAGAMNAIDTINSANAGSVSVTAVWPAAADGSEVAFITLTDGVGNAASATMSPSAGGGGVTFTAIDASGLNDGPITVVVDVTDVNGNNTTVNGTAATKDTSVAAPTAATIPASANNNADTISQASAAAVQVDVTFPAAADGTESATVTLRDGVNPDVVSSSQPITAGGGTFSFSGLNASGLADGSVDIIVTVTDTAMNSAATTAATVSKDSAVPALPTAAKVLGSAVNPDHIVNIATESSVTVELMFPGSSVASDVATVTLDDGVNSASVMVNAPAGGGTLNAGGINCTGFNQGALTLRVTMSDPSGNPAGPFIGTAATFDTDAPAPPQVNPVMSPWNQGTQDITGVGVLNLDVVVDGGSSQAVATADGGGAFVVTVPLTASSTNSLSVMTRDSSLNFSTPVTVDYNGATLDIVQDPTAPSVPFTDDTSALGLGHTGAVDGGAFADIDNDGDLDLFVGSAGAGVLYENSAGSFLNITATAGVTFDGDRSAVWGDYDNDGDVDLLTVSSTNGTTLYRNNFVGLGTRTFTDVTTAEAAGIASTTLTQAMWLDHNNDGYLDFLALDASLNSNVLMVNQRGAGVPSNSFLQDATTGIDNNISASALGAVADFDVDGDIDVIFGDMSPGLFYRNDGVSSFTNIGGVTSNVVFDHSSTASGITFADYDNDGDFDIFIPRGGASSVNQLWRNDGASTFTEVAALAGIDADVNADDVCWGDLNNDGILDLFIGSNGANKLYLGLGDTNMDGVFEFSEIASDLGVGVDDANDADMVQMADIDNDGDLDLFVGNEGSANILYRNGLVSFNYMKIRVTGQGTGAGTASSDGRGAVVTLKDAADNILATREISGGRGKGSQNVAEAHFGGLIPTVKYKFVVDFPSGNTRTIFVSPRQLPNQTFTINE